MNTDEKYITQCISLAPRGMDKVAPNPLVGAVVVKTGRLVGRGYHRVYGGPHAEVYALNQAGINARGATLYVNLEPCCHTYKQTPPCVPQIIQAGIKRVVIAMKDPNPLVKGKGISQLTRAGIRCKTGILEPPAQELNRVYIKNVKYRIPYITVKTAMTVDGKIATYSGQSKWISSVPAREYGYGLRGKVDAILVGIETVVKDNPDLTAHGYGKNPTRVVIDPRLRIPISSKILNRKAKTILILATETMSKQPVKIRILKTKHIELIPVNYQNGVLNFREITEKLYQTGIYTLLIEGGGETNAVAVNSGLVDELYLFIAPKLFGGRDAKTCVEGTGTNNPQDAVTLEFKQIQRIGPDVLVHARVLN